MKHLVVIVLLLAAPVLARADAKSEAQTHIDRATALHQAGKFSDALGELMFAYSLDPRPMLLYAIGQVHVKLGQCKLAIAFYERFLTTKPDEGPAGAAQEAIASCKKVGDTVVAPEPPAPTPRPDPSPTPIAATAGPEDRVWYRDVVGDALVGGGVVVALMSALVYASAVSKLDDADHARSYSAQQDLVDTAHSDRVYAVLLAATGAALIGGGIYHYVRHADGASTPQIGIAPTRGGAFASFTARF